MTGVYTGLQGETDGGLEQRDAFSFFSQVTAAAMDTSTSTTHGSTDPGSARSSVGPPVAIALSGAEGSQVRRADTFLNPLVVSCPDSDDVEVDENIDHHVLQSMRPARDAKKRKAAVNGIVMATETFSSQEKLTLPTASNA